MFENGPLIINQQTLAKVTVANASKLMLDCTVCWVHIVDLSQFCMFPQTDKTIDADVDPETQIRH